MLAVIWLDELTKYHQQYQNCHSNICEVSVLTFCSEFNVHTAKMLNLEATKNKMQSKVVINPQQ